MVRRDIFETLLRRVAEPRRFIQVLAGPRQVGKTTVVRQVMEAANLPAHYASADEPTLRSPVWLEQQWDLGRLKARETANGALLVLDEIQKIPGWSDQVKRLWDADTHARVPLRVVLLGSAPLLVQRGLGESLAGRFEVIPVPHWSFAEMREAFGWDVEQFIFWGGYPGAAPLVGEPGRWRQYLTESLMETTLARDILLLTRVDKPALLRQLFHLACDYSGQILAYQKMLGQLHDAGNTVTLAHYLELLRGAGMVAGLGKFTGSQARVRGSSPKLQVLNTALMSAHAGRTFAEAREEGNYWGRLVESAIGAQLLNSSQGTGLEVFYWRDRNLEVDFVLRLGRKVTALEVKSGRGRDTQPGMEAFARHFKPTRKLLVGSQGVPVEEFLSKPAGYWVG